MKKWYEITIDEKISLVRNNFKLLDIQHIQLLVSAHEKGVSKAIANSGVIIAQPTPTAQIDGTHCDGSLQISMVYENSVEHNLMTFCSIHEGNIGYIQHVLRTTAFRLAKRYFNI